jgi:hypothetical protein
VRKRELEGQEIAARKEAWASEINHKIGSWWIRAE